MDDVTFDFAEDAADDVTWKPWAAAVATIVLLVGTYIGGKYLQPPPITMKLAPPMPQPVYIPVQALNPMTGCGKLPACPLGRTCRIDQQCRIEIQ